MVLRLNCWSGPRNVSTALMYSFRQRADTTVVDEPLYGHYLRVTGRDHPGAAEVMEAMETDGERVVQETILGPCSTPVLFLKQMAHHLVFVDAAFLGQCRNILLVRDPAEMLPSLAVQLPDANLNDTGLAWQVEMAEAIVATGHSGCSSSVSIARSISAGSISGSSAWMLTIRSASSRSATSAMRLVPLR